MNGFDFILWSKGTELYFFNETIGEILSTHHKGASPLKFGEPMAEDKLVEAAPELIKLVKTDYSVSSVKISPHEIKSLWHLSLPILGTRPHFYLPVTDYFMPMGH